MNRLVRTLLGRFSHDRRGVVAVEFALVVPVFLLMVYGFMELGRMLFIQNSLGHAVYEAQRYAIVHGASSSEPADAAAIHGVIVERAAMLDGDLLTSQVTFAPDNEPGSQVTIVATYQFDFMTGLIPVDPFDMTSNSVATIAY
jgi:Flp pilus assembly protein TadG